MAFSIKAEVPAQFKWDALQEYLKEVSVSSYNFNDPVIFDQYAWLLQITSWSYDINWNPKENTVELELPLHNAIDMTVDLMDSSGGYARDPMSNILFKIMEAVPLNRVRNKFAVVDPAPRKRR